MASRKMVNAHTLWQKYKPHFELPKNSVLRLHKAQYKHHTMAARHMHAPPENPELGILQTGNQMNCKTGLEVFMIMFFLLIFIFC